MEREGEWSVRRGHVHIPDKHVLAKEKPSLKWYLNEQQQQKKIEISMAS
jgi:hypothetical protein